MAYQFIRQEPCYDHILFVLALDRDKMKERILIGTEQQIRFRLDGNKDNDVIYDITRPLGRFTVFIFGDRFCFLLRIFYIFRRICHCNSHCIIR